MALLLLRRKYQKHKAEALFDELLNVFIAKNGDALDRAFELREKGEVISWEDYCALWLRWRRISQWKNRVVSSHRRHHHASYARALREEWLAHRAFQDAARAAAAVPAPGCGARPAKEVAISVRTECQKWWRARVKGNTAAYCVAAALPVRV